MKTLYHKLAIIISASALFLSACGSESTTVTAQDSTPNFTVSGALSLPAASISRMRSASAEVQNVSVASAVAGAPTSITITVYEFYVSAHEDCSSPILVSNTEKTVDMATDAAQMFSGSIDPGTYPCIILKMDDVMNFRPNAVAEAAFPDACSTAVDSTFDIYRTDSSEGTNYWRDILGNPILPSGAPGSPSNDHVFIYASTNSAAAIAGPLGVNLNQTSDLTGALQVPGATTFTITIPANSISDNNGFCWLEQLGLGFE